MQRCLLTTAAIAGVFAPAVFSCPVRAQAPSGEPTYTATLPDKQTLKLQIKVARNSGGQTVTVQSRPRETAPAPLFLETLLVAGSDGNVQTCRASFGPMPSTGVLLEAVRQPGGAAYQVGIPETHGTLPFGGKIFTPLLAELFIGRMYDWKKSGPQNFAWPIDAPNDVRVVTLTLSAANAGKTETVALPDGDLLVRRLHAEAVIPFLPTGPLQKAESDFLVGPGGEVVKCETAFFGFPFTAKGKAAWDSGTRWALHFATPANVPQIPPIVLRADKQSGANAGWNIGLNVGEPRSAQTIAVATCDANLQLRSMETPWRGRPTKVQVVGSEIRWDIEADKGQFVATPSGRTWWLASWFVTSLWEGPQMPFADMEASGEKRTGEYFPLFTGQRDAGAFTLERLPDGSASVGGRDVPVHHYRFVSKNVYDVYSDGSRLLALIASDKTTIIRDGWEVWAKAMPVPDPLPVPSPPAITPPPTP